MILWSVTGLRAGQKNTHSKPGFYASLQTDIRRDHAGLSTTVVTGKNRLVFDCGSAEDHRVPPIGSAVRAVFFTHLDAATTSGIERFLDSPSTGMQAEPPLLVWGPLGTREWMRRRLRDSRSIRQNTAEDLEEGPIAQSDGSLVLAIAVSDGQFAYLVTDPGGQSVLIAADVPSSRRLAGLSRNVDLAIVRHTNERVAGELFEGIQPRLAVLAPDGIPATPGGIREIYRGPLHIVPPGRHRIDVPVRGRRPATRGRP